MREKTKGEHDQSCEAILLLAEFVDPPDDARASQIEAQNHLIEEHGSGGGFHARSPRPTKNLS